MYYKIKASHPRHGLDDDLVPLPRVLLARHGLHDASNVIGVHVQEKMRVSTAVRNYSKIDSKIRKVPITIFFCIGKM